MLLWQLSGACKSNSRKKKEMERAKGFEPSTSGLGSQRSTTELRPLGEWRA
jgi:hypothetical protein